MIRIIKKLKWIYLVEKLEIFMGLSFTSKLKRKNCRCKYNDKGNKKVEIGISC